MREMEWRKTLKSTFINFEPLKPFVSKTNGGELNQIESNQIKLKQIEYKKGIQSFFLLKIKYF